MQAGITEILLLQSRLSSLPVQSVYALATIAQSSTAACVCNFTTSSANLHSSLLLLLLLLLFLLWS
jgi:hypothetical protein